MFKQNALQWLISNVTKWPSYEHGITSAPNGWRWCRTMLGMELIKNEPTTLYADMHIQQQEWLNGTDAEPMTRTDAHPRIAIDFTARCNRIPIKYNAEPIGFGAKKLPIYYIAGPMTGYVNFNRESFHSAGLKLSMKGHILNPAMLPDGLTQQQYMSICLPMVQAATHIFMLKGWEKSPGALTEHSLAVKLKLVIEHE